MHWMHSMILCAIDASHRHLIFIYVLQILILKLFAFVIRWYSLLACWKLFVFVHLKDSYCPFWLRKWSNKQTWHIAQIIQSIEISEKKQVPTIHTWCHICPYFPISLFAIVIKSTYKFTSITNPTKQRHWKHKHTMPGHLSVRASLLLNRIFHRTRIHASAIVVQSNLGKFSNTIWVKAFNAKSKNTIQ